MNVTSPVGSRGVRRDVDAKKEKLLALGLDREEVENLSSEKREELLNNLTLLRLAHYELGNAA